MYAAVAGPAQPKTAAHEALTAIDACIARLDATLDVGYERVSTRCPQLARSLERSDWAQWLPSGWKEARNELSAGSLAELRLLVSRELEERGGVRAPRVNRLNAVLAGLGPAAKERSSLWSRFRAWLRTVVERNSRSDNRSWLDKMIQRNGRSQTVIDLLTYGALGLIVVLAGVIVVNEMRAAGLLQARTRAAAGEAPLGAARISRLSWRDVEHAATAEKPRLLLELVIAKLAELKRIPPAGALTVRELARHVELADAADRERLTDIAFTAERARYSAASLPAETVGQTMQRGRELLRRLENPA